MAAKVLNNQFCLRLVPDIPLCFMNFLAHFVLSYPDQELMAGNYIADFLSKKEQNQLDAILLPGLQMHRWIDHYTDSHARISDLNSFFRPVIHHYAPVATDIVMDHLLYRRWNDYMSVPYEDFSEYAYSTLLRFEYLFPERPRSIAQKMIQGRWLTQYQSIEGLTDVMIRMNQKATFDVDFTKTIPVLENNMYEISRLFASFFTMARAASMEWISLRNEGKK
ncbi:MAG: ACP phosphodiesterase [Saprospiraceae bacterium]